MVLAQSAVAMTRSDSLRMRVLAQTGEDVNNCCSCALCEEITDEAGDVSLSMLIQLILANDERALTCRTVWSDEVVRKADQVCTNQMDLPAVLLALRNEARRRGLREGVSP